jgi:hypothetical protein
MSESGSVLSTNVPHKSAPNRPLASRFEGRLTVLRFHSILTKIAWQDVLEQLKSHFSLISSAEVNHNKQLRRLAESVPQPFSKYDLFEKGGSVQGLGDLLYEQMSSRVTHSDHIIAALDTDIIPTLEQTEQYVQERVGHIRGLDNDFKNDLATGMEESRKSLAHLHEAISGWEANNGVVSRDLDPFIVDLRTRKDLRFSLGEENYLRETTMNLERSSQDLEKIVIETVQKALAKYNDLVSTEAAELATMSQKVEEGILAGHLNTEWTHFTKRQIAAGTLIDPSTSARSLETMNYAGKDHISTAPICDGWLEKKSKYLSNYSTAFYIISPSRYLHEFRSNDLRVDSEPTFSLYLPDCEIANISKENDKVHRLVLKGKEATSGIHTDRDWTFRAKSRQDVLMWYLNIGRASDPTYQYKTSPASGVKSTSSNVPALPPASLELEHDEEEQGPFRGPETVTLQEPSPRRVAAGRFDTGGFATPWAAAAAALHAQPASQLRDSESGRLATTTYGSPSAAHDSLPVTYPEHEAHLKQASTNSSAAHFLDKEILDDNAYLEYDKLHGTHSTLVGDEDFKPAGADVTVSRSSSINANNRPRRSSSLAFQELPGSPTSSQAGSSRKLRQVKPPSRKATATYGDLSNLPLPSMTEVNEATTPEPYISPYFPAPGAGTTGALPASNFDYSQVHSNTGQVTKVQPLRASATNSGANTPQIPGQPRLPVRKMSLSEQILAGGISAGASSTSVNQVGIADKTTDDLEPNVHVVVGTHDDARSPYPAAQRFRVPRSRQGSLISPTPDAVSEPLEAYDVAPHMRVGTQSNEARYKVGSRRGSRSASIAATPQESHEPSMFDRSALDTLSADMLASKLNEPSTGEKARARRPPSRGASMDLGDGTSSPGSPAFNVNARHNFRKPPSRGSSLSLGSVLGGVGGDGHNLLNTISETFEKDLAAAKGNKPGDTHVPGDFPK